MTPLFQPRLLNPPFGDPALYVRLQGEGKALLFDLGDISRVAHRLLLRITDIFISHTHIDHFIGIDHLLRINLARNRTLRLYGPPGIIGNITGKLRGYTWNLTQDYPFTLEVFEIGQRTIRIRRFTCKDRLKPGTEERLPFSGTVINNPLYRVKALRLDHNGIVSMAYRLEEHRHININRDALNRLGLPVGPWLQELKARIREGCPDSTPVTIPAREDNQMRNIPLGELIAQLVHITPGEIIAYVSDCGATAANEKKIKTIAANADHFFCEAAFLERDAIKALSRGHLTARQAGRLARSCGARSITAYHFSPRYESQPEDPAREAIAGFEDA